jgi:TetR/AcrR family transcriptional regulator, cholesterol catabolism regulator
MEPTKEYELLLKIGEILKKFGVKSTTMDDIANHLRISKKTLYKYFKDKNEVVQRIVQAQCEFEKLTIVQIVNESKNAIDELIRINNFVSSNISNVHASTLFDLEKYYPVAFSYFCDHKETYVRDLVKSNLKKGVVEGFYRDNLDIELVTIFYLELIETIWTNEALSRDKFTLNQVHSEIARYHIRGIASPKGHEYLSNLITTGTFTLL